jgi:hypothetical protein
VGVKTPAVRAGCQKPRKGGSKSAGRNVSERYSVVRLVSRKVIGMAEPLMSRAKATDSVRQETGEDTGHPRRRGGGTLIKDSAEQERPSPSAMSGKDRAYKAEG